MDNKDSHWSEILKYREPLYKYLCTVIEILCYAHWHCCCCFKYKTQDNNFGFVKIINKIYTVMLFWENTLWVYNVKWPWDVVSVRFSKVWNNDDRWPYQQRIQKQSHPFLLVLFLLSSQTNIYSIFYILSIS